MNKTVSRFHSAIKSPFTREVYDRYLRYFLNFAKIKEPEGLLQLRPALIVAAVMSPVGSPLHPL